MPKKTAITEEERELFKMAVKQATPLASSYHNIQSHQHPKPTHSLKKRIQQPNDHALLEPEPLLPLPSVGPEETLQFTRPGLQTRVIQKLKRREFEIDAVLDLHGFNLTEAEQLLQRFLTHAVERHWRYVQIIHGKGSRSTQKPLLKNCVNQWLRAYTDVLAFCSARPNEGGAGAVYVLLKNSQNHRI